MMIHKTFKYRLYPNQAQAAALVETLDRCRELYNAALQERRDAWQMAHKSLSYYAQKAELPAVKEVRPEYRAVHSQVLQDVVLRVDRSFQAFFRRVKVGQTPGYPRFQGARRYNSFTYPQNGHGAWKIEGRQLILSMLGTFRIKVHRPMEGTTKTCTIRRDGDQWYVAFSCAVDTQPLPPTDSAVGIDLGITYFAALSTGETVVNPRFLRRSLAKLQAAQAQLSRCQRGSHRRGRARRVVTRLHRRIRNQRVDFCHKAARRLVNEYGTVVLEDLRLGNMVQNHKLALSISDASWGQFITLITVKAGWAGRQVVLVNPAYTSQTCSGCGTVRKKELSERWHSCACGTELDRDHNAAINILRLGSSQRASVKALTA